MSARAPRRKRSEGVTWPSKLLLDSFFLLLRLADLSQERNSLIEIVDHMNTGLGQQQPGMLTLRNPVSFAKGSKAWDCSWTPGFDANFGSSAAALSPNFPSWMLYLSCTTLPPFRFVCSAEARCSTQNGRPSAVAEHVDMPARYGSGMCDLSTSLVALELPASR